MPSANHRYIPDWSFTAASHDGYLVETQGALYLIGGTSASSPSSAGVMAIICQKTGSRQGLANTRIYQLANAQYASGGTVIFHDITSGNNSVSGLTGFSCTTGYDEVTGVGSVDVNALANNWVAGTTYSISGTVSRRRHLRRDHQPHRRVHGEHHDRHGRHLHLQRAGERQLHGDAEPLRLHLRPHQHRRDHQQREPDRHRLHLRPRLGPITLFTDGFEGTGWSTAQVSGTPARGRS